MVEPTTEAGAFGYKYIRAYFSSALTSLDADDIEIRNKKNNQLYSVDTVKLSADGTSADITLYGSVQEGNTSFLAPATIYTMEITQNGASATYEFELPANASDEIVTAVDVENSTITVVPSGRTNAGTVAGEYAIGDVYDGDISGLVGRTVNIGTNSDNKVVKISVNDEEVVTGKMKYIQGSKADNAGAGVANLKDSYFEDALTGIKYYFSSTNTSNVNYTQAFKAWNGEDYFRAGDDGVGNLEVLTQDLPNPPHDATSDAYDYVQLTLNTNGTVAVAMVDPRWTSNILVNDVDDTIVVESEKMTLDVDGYTIVKGGVYVSPDDLEEGDVLYYDTTNKFAEVYNNEVTGTISKVTSEKVTIDGEKYSWDGAKYYSSSDKAYNTLDGQADNVGAQKYLNSLSKEDDVTIILNRGGSIAYITGTEEEAESDSKAVYMTNRLGQAYAQDLKNYAQITLSDGTDQSVRVDLSKLTSYAGKDLESGGAKINTENAAQPWKTTLDFDFTVASGKVDITGSPVGSATASGLKDTAAVDGEFPIGALIKVTTNPAGVVVGLEKLGAVGTMTATSKDDITAQPQLENTDTTITAGGKVLALTSSTRIWTIDKDLNVKQVAFSDYEGKTAANKQALVSVYADNTKASDVVINNLDGDAIGEATEDYAAGIVMDVQMAANGSSNEVSEITIKAADGFDYTFDGAGKKNTTEPENGSYVVVTLDKDTLDLHDGSSIAIFGTDINWNGDSNGDTIQDLFTSTLTPGRGSNATTLLPEDGSTLTAKSGALILKRKDENKDGIYEYSPIEIGTINAATNKQNIYYHAVDINGVKKTADIIVVEDVAASAEAGVAVLKPITGELAANAVIGTWTDNQPEPTVTTPNTQSVAGILQIKQTNGTWATGPAVTVAGNSVKINAAYSPIPETEYRLLIAHASTGYTDAASNTVKTAASEKSKVGKAGTGELTDDTVTITGSVITPTNADVVINQFGSRYMTKAAGIVDKTTANITSNDGSTIKGTAQLAVDNTGAITLSVTSLRAGETINPTVTGYAGDVFTFLGCKFTVGAYTGPTAITTLTAGTFVSEDTTTLTATLDQTFDLGVTTAGDILGDGVVKLYESTTAGGTEYTEITSSVKSWTTTGSADASNNAVDANTTAVKAVLTAKRGYNYKFEVVSDDEMSFTSVGLDDVTDTQFSYVTPPTVGVTSFAGATTGALVFDTDLVGAVTVTATEGGDVKATETFQIVSTSATKDTVMVTETSAAWTAGDSLAITVDLDSAIYGPTTTQNLTYNQS